MSPAETIAMAVASGLAFLLGVLAGIALVYRIRTLELRGRFDDDVARMTASRLGADEVPEELLREVTLKSGGNPLYIEEYLRALDDSGAIAHRGRTIQLLPGALEMEIPKTLRGMVAQRLHRFARPNLAEERDDPAGGRMARGEGSEFSGRIKRLQRQPDIGGHGFSHR